MSNCLSTRCELPLPPPCICGMTLVWKGILSISVVQSLSCVWLFATPGLQHARLPCPSLSPRVCSDSFPLSWWCCLTISCSASLFFCLQSSPASGSLPMNRLFASSGQNIGASASVLVLPMNIEGWFALGLTALISLESEGLTRVFSSCLPYLKEALPPSCWYPLWDTHITLYSFRSWWKYPVYLEIRGVLLLILEFWSCRRSSIVSNPAAAAAAATKSLQLCLTLCDSMDCSLPGSSIHGIFQARVLTGVGCHCLLHLILAKPLYQTVTSASLLSLRLS